MPALAAHYQFGQDVLSRLDDKIRTYALAFRREFDAGLQGPDVFYFYKPYRRTKVRAYGAARHNEPAVKMFAPILEQVREEAALSYLLGLLCHYVLDKSCHPYVIENSRRRYEHQRMEAAFDRYLMSACGLDKARYMYLPSGGMDDRSMASLWPGMTARTMKKSIAAERRGLQVLDHRKFLETCEKIINRPGALTVITLPETVSGALTAHVANLLALYNKALEECPALIRTALDRMGTTLTEGLGFDLNYKGKTSAD